MKFIRLFLLLPLLLLHFHGLASNPTTTKKKASPANVTTEVEKLQKEWDKITSFEASFKQTVVSIHLGTEDFSQGKIIVLKPDKLLWISETENSTQILNGNKLISVQTNKRKGTTLVDIFENISETLDTRVLDFLSGKRKFNSEYNFQLISESETAFQVKFSPKKKGQDSLLAEIDKKNHLLSSITNETDESKTHIQLLNLKTNTNPDAKLFDYQPKPSDTVHRQ